jgi:hypothetical protein
MNRAERIREAFRLHERLRANHCDSQAIKDAAALTGHKLGTGVSLASMLKKLRIVGEIEEKP